MCPLNRYHSELCVVCAVFVWSWVFECVWLPDLHTMLGLLVIHRGLD